MRTANVTATVALILIAVIELVPLSVFAIGDPYLENLSANPFLLDPSSRHPAPTEEVWKQFPDPLQSMKLVSHTVCNGSCLWQLAPALPKKPVNLLRFLADSKVAIATHLGEMEKLGLRQGVSGVNPWSGFMWATGHGSFAYRYARGETDPENFMGNLDAYNRDLPKWGAQDLLTLSKSGLARINSLSAVEKYDYLIGDQTFDLTRSSWKTGVDYIKQFNQIASYAGDCQGWARAAVSEKRPLYAVKAVASNNVVLTFYPDDIKGLATAFWASGFNEGYSVGTRCEEGHANEESCWDPNPAAWHVAMTNVIGRGGLLIFDRSGGPPIWNYPISSYTYSYFKPSTRQTTNSLEGAIETIGDRKGRSQYAQYVVGVEMVVRFNKEIKPMAVMVDSQQDIEGNQTYVYDLELDGNGFLVGGAWYDAREDHRPDYAFMPNPEERFPNELEDQLEVKTWKPSEPIPSRWAAAGRITSQRLHLPHPEIFRTLIERSQHPSQ